MKVKLIKNRCVVTKEEGDHKFYGKLYAKGESALLYHIKKELNKQGFDFIKKRMWKDGHMVDDLQQYLRERKFKKVKEGYTCLAIFNSDWAIRGAEEAFNNGEIILTVIDIGGK